MFEGEFGGFWVGFLPNPNEVLDSGIVEIDCQQCYDRMGLGKVPEVAAEEPDNWG